MGNKRSRITVALLIAVVLAGSACYLSFMNKQIYEESRSHILEIYDKLDASLSMFVSINWGILADWGSYSQTAPTEDEYETIRAFISESKENWGFTDFYFINDRGEYIMPDGEQGYIVKLVGEDDDSQSKEFYFDGTRRAFTAVLSNGEKQVFFAADAIDGTYMGFDYSGVCISYSSQAVRDIIDISSFYGASENHVVYPNGDVMFSTLHGDEIGNILTDLQSVYNVSESVIEDLKTALENGDTGMLLCYISGEPYYVVYCPVSFYEGTLIGIIPQSVANSNMRKVQIGTVIMLLCLFAVVLAATGIYVYQRGRKKLDDKIKELEYRDSVMDMITSPTDDVYVIFSRQQGVMYVSPNIERVLGIEKDAVMGDVQALSQIVQDEMHTLSDERLDSIAKGKSWEADRYLINHKTKECRWYSEKIYHIMDDAAVDTYVLLLSDRTRERMAQQQLSSALDSARSANEAKSVFLSNMSHDIRTPMNAIMGCADLLVKEAGNEEKVREYAGKITSSGELLLGLINDILDLSRVESGKVSLNFAPFKLFDLVDEVSAIIMPQAQAKQQTFDIIADDFGSVIYVGDKVRLAQILMNLLSNSVKYTQDGGKILLRIKKAGSPKKRRDGMRQRIGFEVSDNGMGMTEDFLKVIFEPFVREKSDTVSEIQGTGLGMAITKNLVDIMGGTISVKSAKGKGSSFLVNLSLRVCDGECAQREEARENSAESELSIKGMNFLVVEDFELNYEILQERLKLEGADCEVATNGQEGVEAFEQSEPGHFDAILMDVQMPVMNGYEATKAIRSGGHPLAKSIPIVAMTANAFEEDEIKSIEAGMNAHLTKPVDMAQLKSIVNKLSTKSLP